MHAYVDYRLLLPFAVDIHRKQCDEVADKCYASYGQQNVPYGYDDRVCLYHETAWHADESEMLLEQGETDSDYKTGKKTDK